MSHYDRCWHLCFLPIGFVRFYPQGGKRRWVFWRLLARRFCEEKGCWYWARPTDVTLGTQRWRQA